MELLDGDVLPRGQRGPVDLAFSDLTEVAGDAAQLGHGDADGRHVDGQDLGRRDAPRRCYIAAIISYQNFRRRVPSFHQIVKAGVGQNGSDH